MIALIAAAAIALGRAPTAISVATARGETTIEVRTGPAGAPATTGGET